MKEIFVPSPSKVGLCVALSLPIDLEEGDKEQPAGCDRKQHTGGEGEQYAGEDREQHAGGARQQHAGLGAGGGQ